MTHNIIGASLSEPHIDQDNGPARGIIVRMIVCIIHNLSQAVQKNEEGLHNLTTSVQENKQGIYYLMLLVQDFHPVRSCNETKTARPGSTSGYHLVHTGWEWYRLHYTKSTVIWNKFVVAVVG